jgi:hypothetical protein
MEIVISSFYRCDINHFFGFYLSENIQKEFIGKTQIVGGEIFRCSITVSEYDQ